MSGKIKTFEKKISEIRQLIQEAETELSRLKSLTDLHVEYKKLKEKYNFLRDKLNLLERMFSMESDPESQQIVVTVKRIKYEIDSPVEIQHREQRREQKKEQKKEQRSQQNAKPKGEKQKP